MPTPSSAATSEEATIARALNGLRSEMIETLRAHEDPCDIYALGALVRAYAPTATDLTQLRDALAHSTLGELVSAVAFALDDHENADDGEHVASQRAAEPSTFTDEELSTAANRAAEEILEAIDAPDEGPRDLVNLLVNVTGHYLANPAATLTDAIEANYGEPAAEVLDWAKR